MTPTGSIVPTTDGFDLVLTRRIRGRIDDVWASVTEPDRTARWFGRWEGAAAPGAVVRLQMGFEEGTPWFDATIAACEPPTQLTVTTNDDSGSWHLEIRLAPAGDLTELTFVQHRVPVDGAAEIGPGWEYYLDQLIASRDDLPLPTFDDYYPALADHYRAAAARAQS